jgi:predicted transcriptional regulator
MSRKKTHEEFVKELYSININIEILGIYNGNKSFIAVKCKICNGEWSSTPDNLLHNYGCPYCTNQKILIGFNDMWTTNPELAKLLYNPEDGYKYTQGTTKKANWKCPNCNNIIKNKSISNVRKHGLSCNLCSDGVSYPNKIMYNILNQLNINFIPEYCPIWLKSKRYDFYFENDNNKYIVEMDGAMGHGRFNLLSKMTPEESLAIDKYKDELALKHNINIIRIDCFKSELEYIKNSIINSRLNIIFDLNKVNWQECHKSSLNNFVKLACNLWQVDGYKVKHIAYILKLSTSTIVKYLKRGKLLNWCDYDSQKEIIENLKNMTPKAMKVISKKVRCIETNQIFESIMDASRQIGCSDSHISQCCKGKRNTCGKLEDGTKLHWEYTS